MADPQPGSSDATTKHATPRAIARMSVVESVIHEVRRSILDGSLPPGAPVSIRDLSEQLEVSHIPVREALRRLEGEGLIEMRRSRSAVVAPLTAEDLENVFRLRRLLEGHAYARVTPRFEDEHIAAIERAYSELALRSDDDVESLSRRHLAFHRLLAQPAASDWDLRLLDMVWRANDRYLSLAFEALKKQDQTSFRDQHSELLNAARARSSSQMERAVDRHLQHGIGWVGPQLQRLASR